MKMRLFSARLLKIRQHLRWGALLAVGLACGGLVHLALSVRHEVPAPVESDGAVFTLRDFRSEIYEQGRWVRVSGAGLRVVPAKLAGPFRLGFAQALVGQHLTLELFPQDTATGEAATRSVSEHELLGSLTPSLSRLVLSGMPGQSGITLAQAECGPLTILSHEGTETLVLFAAEQCGTNLGMTKVRCTDGMIRQGESILLFRELSYNGRHWQLRTRTGQLQQVDAWLDFGRQQDPP